MNIDNEEILKVSAILKKEKNLRIDRDAVEYKKNVGIDDDRLNKILVEYSLGLEQIRDYAYFSEKDRSELLQRFDATNTGVAINYLGRDKLFLEKYLIRQYDGLQYGTYQRITKFVLDRLFSD